ncbi:MAG: DUF3127 domain-containing protein [Akkermansiaceae bacterium]
MYEATGKIKVIFDTQTFPSGFSKREFVVTVGDNDYPQDIKYEIMKDKCALLDKFEVGQEVTVSFDIRGNEYKEKYYVNLNCWKITSNQTSGGTSTKAASAPISTTNASSEAEPSPDELMNDDIPF